MRILRRLFKLALWGITLLVAFVAFSNWWVINSTQKHVHEQPESLESHKVALVLGTSKRFAGGSTNLYFKYRIEAAAELYHAGKVKHILVSGDNRSKFYNEPEDMRKALLAKGVPNSAITLDYAGLRTLDSVIRAKKIFGQEDVVIVTQKFHSYRALFIGNHYGLEASAYAAQNMPFKASFNIIMREVMARPLAMLDVYLLRTQPRHLGKQEPIQI